jgi:hypothetical protein
MTCCVAVYSVSADTVRRTSECKKDLACLTADANAVCPVESPFGQSSHRAEILRCLSGDPCSYKVTCGDTAPPFCLCPVRIEIFNLYGE